MRHSELGLTQQLAFSSSGSEGGTQAPSRGGNPGISCTVTSLPPPPLLSLSATLLSQIHLFSGVLQTNGTAPNAERQFGLEN